VCVGTSFKMPRQYSIGNIGGLESRGRRFTVDGRVGAFFRLPAPCGITERARAPARGCIPTPFYPTRKAPTVCPTGRFLELVFKLSVLAKKNNSTASVGQNPKKDTNSAPSRPY